MVGHPYALTLALHCETDIDWVLMFDQKQHSTRGRMAKCELYWPFVFFWWIYSTSSSFVYCKKWKWKYSKSSRLESHWVWKNSFHLPHYINGPYLIKAFSFGRQIKQNVRRTDDGRWQQHRLMMTIETENLNTKGDGKFSSRITQENERTSYRQCFNKCCEPKTFGSFSGNGMPFQDSFDEFQF